jgi:mannose/cellobiose epimerase-like protein (N-acyl-D-glucosamine 2-epimerase family)
MTNSGNTETTIGSESQDIVKILRTLMIEHSLPLWSREGWDSAAGGFVERLCCEGSRLWAPR